ncbi:MAG TPA: hypothetical protein VFI96_02750 [Longimicrobiaceae bacterium]|nr:hypothetical protein [Longimicrobiaceae bacterium]
MDEPVEREEQPSCRASAQRVLHAYRERRRRRRDDDAFFGSTDVLLEQAEKGLAEKEVARRRSELVEEAEACGMSRELAEFLYEVAREEGLDPGLAMELVASGLAVCPPPDGVSNASEAPATDKYLPTWMFPASPPERVMRERTLHLSFRRLRSFLERYHDVEEAFRHFADEPDVGHCGY